LPNDDEFELMVNTRGAVYCAFFLFLFAFCFAEIKIIYERWQWKIWRSGFLCDDRRDGRGADALA
jgi:hypothetical protein